MVIVGQQRGTATVTINGKTYGGRGSPLFETEITLSLGAGNDSLALPAGTQEVRGRRGAREFKLPTGQRLIVEGAEHVTTAPNTPRPPASGLLIS